MITKNQVYARIAQAIKVVYPSAYITGSRNPSPASFPAVWIVEADTYPDSRYINLGMTDRQRRSMFEVQAFSTKIGTATSEVDSIIAIADQEFRQMGYRKRTETPIDDDKVQARKVARFERIIGGADSLN